MLQKHPPHRTGCSDPLAFLPSSFPAFALSSPTSPICWICLLELAVTLLKIYSVLLVTCPALHPGSLGTSRCFWVLFCWFVPLLSFLYILWKVGVCWLLISKPWHLSLLL